MQEPAPRAESSRARRSALEYAARSREGIRAALRDAREARLHAPGDDEHARRFLFGLTAPFTLLRLAWQDAQTRASMLARLTIPVVLMAVGLATGVGWVVDGLIESRHHPAALAAEVDDNDDDDHGESEERKAVNEAATKAALQARAENRSPLAVASAAAAVAEQIEAHQKASRAAAQEHESFLRIVGRFVRSRFAEIFVALGVLEWILVWIIREHHDVLSCEVSRLTGVPAETLPRPPRLRFDFGWLKLKAWRTLRFILFMLVGTPPAWLLGAVPVAGPALAGAWEAAWTAYWASVFAVANTFLAWEPRDQGEDAPWFVRVVRVPGRVPVIGLPFRLYAWVLRKATRSVWPACIAFERAPWEGAGLAVARLVAGIPVLYLVCRPMFPPAATHALASRQVPGA